jgi:hypothetical protein
MVFPMVLTVLTVRNGMLCKSLQYETMKLKKKHRYPIYIYIYIYDTVTGNAQIYVAVILARSTLVKELPRGFNRMRVKYREWEQKRPSVN